jgi:hypothetical protein
MARDSKKTTIDSAPKKAPPAKDKGTDTPKADAGKADAGKADAGKTDTAKTDTAKTDAGKSDTAKPEAPKAEGGETAGTAPKNYSRGEGQKPVTQAYKDNWNAIFGTKKTTKKKKR